MLTEKEKEDLVSQRLDDDTPWNSIAKEAHVSMSFISKVKKKKEGNGVHPSIRTQVYKRFFEGKRSIEVSIEFDLSEEETTKYWKEYLKLTRHYELLKIVEEHKGTIDKFFDLFEEVESISSLDDIREALEMVGKINKQLDFLSILEHDKEILEKEVNNLILKRDKVLHEIDVSKDRLESLNIGIIRYELPQRKY